jgi:hypothetical protein
MKEILGTFTVTDSALRQHSIIVSQESVLDEHGTLIATLKYFNLNNLKGEEVQRTEDPGILTLPDGTILKKTSNIQTGYLKSSIQRAIHRRR